jgi:chemotaxis signal transduction protein
MPDPRYLPSGDLVPRGGTRSTLRLGPATGAGPKQAEHVLLLPLRVGQHLIAIEAARVVEVLPGEAASPAADPDRPFVRFDLGASLGVTPSGQRETILARADGVLGRGPGRFVAFAVDGTLRLSRVPLENLAPLPPVTKEQIEVDYIVGVVRLPFPDDGMAFLLDPMKLAASAPGEA